MNNNFTIRELIESDCNEFSNLVKNMYFSLNNPLWFTPMPYTSEDLKEIINYQGFYIIGIFDQNKLIGISSFDYDGKLYELVSLDNKDTIEIAFNIVHSEYRGNGLMKTMINYLLEKGKKDGYKHFIARVHEDNKSSSKSLERLGFKLVKEYFKESKKKKFYKLIESDVLNKDASIELEKNLKGEEEKIKIPYGIYLL